jgi:hypothetical protein
MASQFVVKNRRPFRQNLQFMFNPQSIPKTMMMSSVSPSSARPTTSMHFLLQTALADKSDSGPLSGRHYLQSEDYA